MFKTVEMARLNVAGPIHNLDEVLRICANLENIHVVDYSGDYDGIGIGTPSDGANSISSLLVKARAAKTELNPVNRSGAFSIDLIKSILKTDFESKLDSILSVIESDRESEAEISRLSERVSVLETIAPLNIPLELMTGISSIEVYVGETSKKKASKATNEFSDISDSIELHVVEGIIAVACEAKFGADVMLGFGNLGARPVQIPTGEGQPSKLLSEAQEEISNQQSSIENNQKAREDWLVSNSAELVAVTEYLEREEDILTGHKLCAVSEHAFALDAWTPLADSEKVTSALSKVSSHITIEKFHDDHHGHGHSVEYPPIEFDMPQLARHGSLLTDLVGRPQYGTIDPTTMMAITFPLFYGLILGDAGYGAIIMAMAWFLGTKIGHDPIGALAARVLMLMGVSTFVVGVLTAEAFGFIIEDWSPFAGFYDWTYDTIVFPAFVSETMGMSHTHIPFHRASGALQDYVLLSVYIGVIHILIGFVIGFINVFKAHGIAAAFFEKGSWLLILLGGFMHVYLYMTDNTYGTFQGSIWSGITVVGVLCLIYGLAIYEKFGWIGGVIMGPIETFGLLANTLSYLRIMAVGVAGVKIAEVGNEMGFETMVSSIESGDYHIAIIGLILWITIQVFALALGLLSPSIHAARLHFVEWMGKFHDGSGEPFTPFGGRPVHTEGH